MSFHTLFLPQDKTELPEHLLKNIRGMWESSARTGTKKSEQGYAEIGI